MLGTLVLTGVFLTYMAGTTEIGSWDVRQLGVIGCVIAALFAVVSGPQRRKTASATGMIAPFTLWLAWLLLSATWSPAGARLDVVVTDVVSLGVLVLATATILPRLPDATLDLFWWLAYGAAAVFAVGALGMGTLTEQGRLTAFGGGPNVFVRIVGLGLFAAIALVLRDRRHWPTLLLAPVFLMAAILSGSRGGLLAIGGCLMVLTLMLLRARSRAVRQWGLAIVLIAPVAAYFTVWPRVEEFVQDRFIQETLNEGYTSGRGSILQSALEIYGDHPIIGAGLDGFWATSGWLSGYEYPHNLYVATAAESGTIGLILLIAATLAGFSRAGLTRDPYKSMFALTAGMIFIASQFSGSWYDSRFMWLLLLMGIETGHRMTESTTRTDKEAERPDAKRAPRPRTRNANHVHSSAL